MFFGIRYDEYGASVGTVKFTKTGFFQYGPDNVDPVRFYQDTSGVRWWVRRDLEKAISPASDYVLSGLCHIGNRWVPRVHSPVGDLNIMAPTTEIRCLLRSEDVIALLERFNSVPARLLAKKIKGSVKPREANPQPPKKCDHCGQPMSQAKQQHAS